MANQYTMSSDVASLKSATSAAAITPHDTNELDPPTRAIHVSVAGTLVAKFEDDDATVSLVVVAGMLYPYRLKLVHTSTDATVVGLY